MPRIVEIANALPRASSAVDLFSGTSRVGYGLKQAGFRVHANDISAYASAIARCYVQADDGPLTRQAAKWIKKLNALPGEPGYITKTFCETARFFQPHNGARIDAIRKAIAEAQLEPELESVLLTALIEAADRVDSTTGVQMAFLKDWAPRAKRNLNLRVPELAKKPRAGKCSAHQMDAIDAARALTGDIAYLDPPYNQHKYLNYYHVWETIVRGDEPDHYGIVCKRADCAEHHSPFNSRKEIHQALAEIVNTIDTRYQIVSFNNEGFISPEQMIELLSARGQVWREEVDYPRYIGAQIGIHDHTGKVVGTVSHLTNKENLFVVLPRGSRTKFEGMVREV